MENEVFLAWVNQRGQKLLNLANDESKMFLSSNSQSELNKGCNIHRAENVLYYITKIKMKNIHLSV